MYRNPGVEQGALNINIAFVVLSQERKQAQELRCPSRFKELLVLPILLVVAVIHALIHPLIHGKNVEHGLKTRTIRELHRERQAC